MPLPWNRTHWRVWVWPGPVFVGALWLGLAAVATTPAWQAVEALAYDWLTVVTAPGNALDGSVVIVGIDDPSFAELGLRWPWPRNLHARLVDRLHEAGAAVVAFDVLFTEPAAAADDQTLAGAIRRAGNVVLAASETLLETSYVVQLQRLEPLEAFLQAGARSGLAGVEVDGDFVPRRVPEAGDSLWRRVLEVYGAPVPAADGDAVGGRLIRYLGPPGSFPYVSYYQALAPQEFLPPDIFRGRIVLVGATVQNTLEPQRRQPALLPTPFLRTARRLTPGVEVHANLVESALRGYRLRELPVPWTLLIAAVTALLAYRSMSSWRPLGAALWAAVLTIGLTGLGVVLFAGFHGWLPLMAPIAGVWLTYLGLGGLSFLKEQAHSRYLRRVFGLYVAGEVIDHMLAHPEALVLGGERREVSFIFTDVAGFTALTETVPPTTLVALLREYFAGMGAIVMAHGGTLERFAGDSLVALFNAPADQPDHAARAVACALALDAFARDFSLRQQALGLPFGVTRIGVNSGEVTVGNFGSDRRFHYTAMGDPINTAARLESANKYFGTCILVSAATASRCSGIRFQPVGEVVFKGKRHAVPVYRPLGGEPAEHLESYRRAYGLLEGEQAAALAAFEALAARWPDDPLCAFHLARLRAGLEGCRIVLAEK